AGVAIVGDRLAQRDEGVGGLGAGCHADVVGLAELGEDRRDGLELLAVTAAERRQRRCHEGRRVGEALGAIQRVGVVLHVLRRAAAVLLVGLGAGGRDLDHGGPVGLDARDVVPGGRRFLDVPLVVGVLDVPLVVLGRGGWVDLGGRD